MSLPDEIKPLTAMVRAKKRRLKLSLFLWLLIIFPGLVDGREEEMGMKKEMNPV